MKLPIAKRKLAIVDVSDIRKALQVATDNDDFWETLGKWFTWGDANLTLVTPDRFLSAIREVEDVTTENVEKLEKVLAKVDYIDLEN